jgi:hypothetical protein
MRPETIEKYRNAIANVYNSIQKGEKIIRKDLVHKYELNTSFLSLIQYHTNYIEQTSTKNIFKWIGPSNPDFWQLSKKYCETVINKNLASKQKNIGKLKSKSTKIDVGDYVKNDPDKIYPSSKLEGVNSRLSTIQSKEELKPETVKQFLEKSNVLPIELTKLEARVLLVLLQQFAEENEFSEFKNFIERISDKVFSKLY